VDDNKPARWTAPAATGSNPARWIAAALIGNPALRIVAGIASVTEMFPVVVPHAEAEVSAAAPATTVAGTRKPAVREEPPAWVPEAAEAAPGAATAAGDDEGSQP
jgi:hypothetical protein